LALDALNMSRAVFSPSWHNVAELKPRLLAHARFYRHHYRGELWHVVHDTTSGRYHRMSPGAVALVRRMDGRRTVQSLWDEACACAGEDLPTQNEMVELLSQLHSHELLHCDVTPDSASLLERFRKQRFARWKQRLGNPLGLRIPLLDPDAFLDRHRGRYDWIFSTRGTLLWLAFVLPALVLALRHWTELTGNLSDRLLSAQNLLLLGALFVPVKALHELGHACATKRWGGAVPEMGVMMLVFAPVPYVDSSSASAFRSKYRRAVVGAAGMLVELFLAAIALYVWLLVEPGLVRAIAFNVMVIAGISTLLINGNPLLRFDGYYILADLIEIPNLAQRGQRYWTWMCDRWLFGARELEPPDETAGTKRWIVPYTVASWVYRCLMTASIIIFVANEFFIFGVLLALWAGGQFLVMPIYKSIKHVRTSPTLQKHRARAFKVSAALVAAGVLALCVLPAPLRTQAEGVVWLPESALIRAGVDGAFERWLVAPGTHVTRGTPLLLMTDASLEAELEASRARVAEFQARYDAEQFAKPAAAEVLLARLEQERRALRDVQARHAKLVVASESSGVLVVAQHMDMPGQRYRKGALLGYLLEQDRLIARVAITQNDIDLVRTKLREARMRLAGRVGETWPVAVLRELPGGVDELPSPALTPQGGGSIPVDPQDSSGVKTLDRVFLFDIQLPPAALPDTFGSRVYVRFEHVREPLARQWYRRIRQLFLSRFDV
jgi:putative peptide zinc metalloprotease protein